MPPVITLLVMMWGMATPSYWRDESATLAATERSIPQLLTLLRQVDAVHGFYYLLVWPVVHFAGSGEFATRLPSAIAMAATALGIVVIGRRLRSRRAGLYAGLVFAALPLVGQQARDARPYAFETAAAVLATYLLVRAAARPAAPRLAAYGLSLAALGYLHLFGLLIIPAHAIALIPVARLEQVRRHEADAAGGGSPAAGAGPAMSPPRLLLRWAVTAVLACLAVAPLVSLGWHQRGAISWLPKPGGRDVSVLIGSFAAGTVTSAMIFGSIALLGLARADWPDKILRPPPRSPAGRAGDAADRAAGRPGAALLGAWARRPEWVLTAAALPWMVLPPVTLVIAAQFKPVYELRYLEYCLPAVALLVGAGIAAVGWPLRFGVLALVAVLGLPLQYDMRQPLFNGYIRGTAQFLAQNKKAGDAIYFPDRYGVPTWDNTYPQLFAGVRVIQQGRTAAQIGRLVGQNLPLQVVEQRLKSAHRLWVAEMTGAWANPPFPLKPDFRLALAWQRNQMWLRLYVRVSHHHHHHHHHYRR